VLAPRVSTNSAHVLGSSACWGRFSAPDGKPDRRAGRWEGGPVPGRPPRPGGLGECERLRPSAVRCPAGSLPASVARCAATSVAATGWNRISGGSGGSRGGGKGPAKQVWLRRYGEGGGSAGPTGTV